MSTPSTSFPLTGDNAVDSMTNGYVWQPGTNRTILWSLSNGWSGEFWTNPTSTANMLTTVFNTFSDVANIKFNYLGYFSNPQAAANSGSDINVSLDAVNKYFNNNNQWALGFFPNPLDPNRGDIYLNINSIANNLPSYEPGSKGFDLAIHEIGHTLGLKHPHDDGGTGRPTFKGLGINNLDLDLFTVMSYNEYAPLDYIKFHPATPMPLDILGLQYLYGKNTSTNLGNSIFNVQEDGKITTIWDAGGNDTVAVANAKSGWTVVLPSVQLSHLIDTKTGYAAPSSQASSNAPTTATWLMGDIENAIGSVYDDQFSGNNFNNVFYGNGGIDTVTFLGSASQYAIKQNGQQISVIDNLANRDGQDTLNNISRLKFNDYNISFDIPHTTINNQIYHLFQAVFGGTPDLNSFSTWTGIASKYALNETQVASYFVKYTDYIPAYGTNVSDSRFVEVLYKNTTGQTADPSVTKYITDVMHTYSIGREQVAVWFAEYDGNVKALASHTDNGYWLV